MGKSTPKKPAPKTTLKVPLKTTAKAATTKKAVAPKVSKIRNLRYAPDPNTLAELHFQMPDGRDIMLFGLVLNESQTGCAIVLVTNEKLRKDDPCLCKIGKLGDMHGLVRWVMLVEKNLMKIGIEYAEDAV